MKKKCIIRQPDEHQAANRSALIHQELSSARSTLEFFISDQHALRATAQAISLLVGAINAGNKILVCGNGGSMCDAMHFATELSGKYRFPRRALPALALSDPAHLTCVGNDDSFKRIFARAVEAIGKRGDILIALSTSGESLNVIQAAETAKRIGLKVVALTGHGPSRLASCAHLAIQAPPSRHADRIQEIHIKILHIFAAAIENALGLSTPDAV